MNNLQDRIPAWLCAAALTAILGNARQTAAEPAPLPEDELRAEADLIVEGRVLWIRNTGYAEFWAQVRIDKTLKGTAPGNPMRYTWVPPEPGLLGPMNHNVFAGQKVRLYLIFERGSYIPWASNSVEWLEPLADDKRVLPHEPGEIIYAAGAAPKACCCPCRRRWRCR